MLTLYYVAATWIQSWRLSSTLTKLKSVLQKDGSLVVHQKLPPYIYLTGTVPQQKFEIDSVLSKQCLNHHGAKIGDLLWFYGNKKIVSIFPKQLLDISGWVTVIPGRTHLPIQIKNKKVNLTSSNKLYVLLEADYNTCQFCSDSRFIEVENYGVPVAWHTAVVLSILLETDEMNLASLCVAFQNDVTLENGIQIIRIETVAVTGHPYKIYNVGTVPECYAPLEPDLDKNRLRESFMSRWRAHISMMCSFCDAVQQVKNIGQEISVRHPGSGVGAVKLVPTVPPGMEEVSKNEACAKKASEKEGDIFNINTFAEPSTPSSGVSISLLSTDTILAAGSTKLADSLTTASLSSLPSLSSTPRLTVTTNFSEKPVKPPNIIVFSDSSSSADSIRAVLQATLLKDRYTFHVLSCTEIQAPYWFHQASLVVIHGNVSSDYTQVIIDFILIEGGSVLCLCSDLLGLVLPVFRTAEVRPNELVHCSYKSWKHVPLMHHVFCYQPAPSAPHFSHDDHNNLSVIPASVDLKDRNGKIYKLKVEVLGVEETWQTPSLLLVSSNSTSAKIIFSQVHLEIEPSQYDIGEANTAALQESDKARLEILCDVLSSHLGLLCSQNTSNVTYTPAYFLGNHEIKQQLLQQMTDKGYIDSNKCLKSGDITIKFCGKGVTPSVASPSHLPVLMHACPETFSTVEYFENLNTESIGRLVFYCQTLTSSMSLVKRPPFQHGFTVIPQYQTEGIGRGGNTWLSPEGCAMFTVQLHIPMDSCLGEHLSLLQCVCSLSVVTAICQLPGLEELDIGLKWPNDIYANKSSKIGGVTISSTLIDSKAICNIGCGLNLNNKEPTLCINDMISALNKLVGSKVPLLTFEKYFSSVFNKMEELYTMAQNDIEGVYSLYYNYWLHTDAEVLVQDHDGTSKSVKVKGIDPYGFLIVQTVEGEDIVVHPDSNSLDMMSGLILPKVQK